MTQEILAQKLIFPIFRGISEAYKSKQYASVWEQVESRTRAAARSTNSLPKWLEIVTSQLQVKILNEHLSDVMEVLNANEDEQIMEWLRNETTLVIMYAQLLNQDRKAFIKLRSERLDVTMPEGANTELPNQDPNQF